MKRLGILAAMVFAALGSASFAAADTLGPITFEPSNYTAGSNINGQDGWSNTGLFDANVVLVSDFAAASGYDFGTQALQISDAKTSGSFGDQTFSPGISVSAGEAPAKTHFDATFEIGTALATEQPGLSLSVSPDNGSGGRMSYLRFMDQSDGVHVFFDDVTDSGPYYTQATFNEKDIATLSRTRAHTIRFSMDFLPGPANDVVNIYIDGAFAATGTSWEDYYRYDNEGHGVSVVPLVSKLLFREGGTQNTANAGNGFLIDNLSLASSDTCAPTGFYRDDINLTAALIDPTGTVSGTVPGGCDIGVYYGPDTTAGSVDDATISGARYFGVVNYGGVVNVSNSTISNIGNNPFDGTQHGVAVFYTTENPAGTVAAAAASGSISGNTVSAYQKGGITARGTNVSTTVQNNTLTGLGQVPFIAQNGIQISFGATALVKGNTVSGNWYTGPQNVTACGLLFYQANGVKQQSNTLSENQTNLCNAGRGGGSVTP